MATDTQGYRVVTGNTTADNSLVRTPQELTAVSWAAFCTDILPPTIHDISIRIQALDTTKLFDRLKLALQMLKGKETKLKQEMEKAGIQFRSNNSDDKDPSSDDPKSK